MRKALLLPALFLILLTTTAALVYSRGGTHMSALMLYPFASPWWMFLPYVEASLQDVLRENGPLLGGDSFRLLAGFTINVALLAFVGFLIDRWAASRRASR